MINKIEKVIFNRMVKIGIIGAGHWGQNHIRVLNNLASHKVCNFIGICDSDSSKEYLSRQNNNYFFTDYKRLADFVDGVIVATPASSLYEIAFYYLSRGKHVLIEKPFALSMKDGKSLVNISKRKKLTLMVGHVFLYTNQIQKIDELLDKQALGNVFYAYSQRLNLGIIRSDVNALWNFGPHDISIFIHIFKSIPKKVQALGKAYLQDKVEDVVFLQMEFPSGALVNCHLSWVDPIKTRKVTIVGDKGMIIWDDTSLDQSIRIYNKKIKVKDNESKKNLNFKEFKSLISHGDEIIPYLPNQEPLKKEILHFIECIKKSKSPLTNGDHALSVLRVLLSAQESLANGGKKVVIL